MATKGLKETLKDGTQGRQPTGSRPDRGDDRITPGSELQADCRSSSAAARDWSAKRQRKQG